MVNAAEIVVQAKPEGVEETKQEIEGLSKSLEETTEGMKSQSGRLASFSKQFAGAMAAATTGLALAATSLLSKTPVIGEAFGALGAVVESVALTMDTVLRPALAPVADSLLDLSDAILTADPLVRKLVGSVSALASGAGLLKLGTFLPIVGDSFAKFNAATINAIKNIGRLRGALRLLIAPLVGLSLPMLVLVGVLAALALAFATNFGDIRGVTMDTFNELKEVFSGFAERVVPTIKSLLTKINGFFKTDLKSAEDVANAVFKGIGLLIVGTVDFILTTLEALLKFLDGDFKGGLKAFGKFFERTFDRLPESVRKPIQDIIDYVTELGDVVDEKIEGVTSTIDDAKEFIGLDTNNNANAGGGAGGGAGGRDTGGEGGDIPFIGSGEGFASPIYFDTTRVDQQQGRVRKNNASVRGI